MIGTQAWVDMELLQWRASDLYTMRLLQSSSGRAVVEAVFIRMLGGGAILLGWVIS